MANKNRYDDLYTGTIAYATLVSVIVLIVTILSIRALTCAWVEGEEQRKTADAHYTSSDEIISEQKALLAGYEKEMVEVTVTPPEGQDGNTEQGSEPTTKMEERIHIPIDRARDILMEELASTANPNT